MFRKAHDSPQARRIHSDQQAIQALAGESSIFRYQVDRSFRHYWIEFKGRSLAKGRGQVVLLDSHQVEIKLGASYPRTMPELRWVSPIFHPNISEMGQVCLGGYNTHWVPSLQLDELCEMLWDMARYSNYDLRSPYNREAALWAASQSTYDFPTDHRPLRDLRVARGRQSSEQASPSTVEDLILILDCNANHKVDAPPYNHQTPNTSPRQAESPPDVIFLD